MALLPIRQAAKELGVAHQTLSYYYAQGRLTGEKVGERVVLVNPEVAKKELEKLGFFERRQIRRSRKRSASADK